MALKRSEIDGKLYGNAPVILAKEENGEINFLIGRATPFGGIVVRDYKGESFVAELRTWWEREGFSVTEAKELEEARSLLLTEMMTPA